MDPVNIVGRPSLLKLFLSENNLKPQEKKELLIFALSVGCTESSKELMKTGACLESGELVEVLKSWEKDDIEIEERLELLTLLFENTKYQPTLQDQSECSIHIRLRLKILLETKEPKSLSYLAKISFKNHLIKLSNGQSIIQTIDRSQSWPKPFLMRLFDI